MLEKASSSPVSGKPRRVKFRSDRDSTMVQPRFSLQTHTGGYAPVSTCRWGQRRVALEIRTRCVRTEVFDPCSLRLSGGFANPAPFRRPQPVELSSFQHPYQNGRGSVASEKVSRERRKMARSGPSSRSSWFGQFARNGRSLRDSDRGSGAEKECLD
jgi:hypothetical protein